MGVVAMSTRYLSNVNGLVGLEIPQFAGLVTRCRQDLGPVLARRTDRDIETGTQETQGRHNLHSLRANSSPRPVQRETAVPLQLPDHSPAPPSSEPAATSTRRGSLNPRTLPPQPLLAL